MRRLPLRLIVIVLLVPLVAAAGLGTVAFQVYRQETRRLVSERDSSITPTHPSSVRIGTTILAWPNRCAVSRARITTRSLDNLERVIAYSGVGWDAGLLAALTQGQEDERKRLARELHDETVQSLIALDQQLQMAQKALSRAPSPEGDLRQAYAARLDELMGVLDPVTSAN